MCQFDDWDAYKAAAAFGPKEADKLARYEYVGPSQNIRPMETENAFASLRLVNVSSTGSK